MNYSRDAMIFLFLVLFGIYSWYWFLNNCEIEFIDSAYPPTVCNLEYRHR